MSVRRALAVCAFVAAFAPSMAAQHTHVLIVTGLAGEPQYGIKFHSAAVAVYQAAKTKWGVADSSLIYLADDPSADPQRIKARSTKVETQNAFLALSHRVAAGDVLVVFLLGHGSGEGPASAVNVSGPDPTAADYASWLAGFAKQTVVFVNASSASGDFVPVLAGPGRIVITATKTAFERNESVFASFLADGLASGSADADKDGRVSVLEAFQFAKQETAKSYTDANKLMTEHAMLSDSTLAQLVRFGAAATSSDPKVAALQTELRDLQDQLTVLKSRKAQMDSAKYDSELERLLIAIAEKTDAVKKAGGGL